MIQKSGNSSSVPQHKEILCLVLISTAKLSRWTDKNVPFT